jgi:hypothetical protein
VFESSWTVRYRDLGRDELTVFMFSFTSVFAFSCFDLAGDETQGTAGCDANSELFKSQDAPFFGVGSRHS